MKERFRKNLITNIKRGAVAALAQALMLILILLVNRSRAWYFAAIIPLVGTGNLALAWFLHLRRDHFLSQDRAPEKEEVPPWEGGFLISGILLLAAASAAYLLGGVGSRYFL